MNTIENVGQPSEELGLTDVNETQVETSTPLPDPPRPDLVPVEPAPDAPHVKPPSSLWKIPLKVMLLAGGVALVYWKRAFLQNASPYIPVVIPSLILLSQIIFKDWNNYKHTWVRWALLCFALSGCAWGILYQNQQIKEKLAAKTRAEAAEKAQRDNTAQFLSSFDQLNSKITDLQTKVATEPLRKELADVKDKLATVRGDLEKTQAALAPGPKASLMFSFPGYTNNQDAQPPVIPFTTSP